MFLLHNHITFIPSLLVWNH